MLQQTFVHTLRELLYLHYFIIPLQYFIILPKKKKKRFIWDRRIKKEYLNKIKKK